MMIEQRKHKTKFWMVVGDGNNPKVRHGAPELASQEAARLARLNPGTEFFVLEAMSKAISPTEVQVTRL